MAPEPRLMRATPISARRGTGGRPGRAGGVGGAPTPPPPPLFSSGSRGPGGETPAAPPPRFYARGMEEAGEKAPAPLGRDNRGGAPIGVRPPLPGRPDLAEDDVGPGVEEERAAAPGRGLARGAEDLLLEREVAQR